MSKDRNNKKGFTLAEVLITLTIIGVVAALTIPSLLSNISTKTYDAKRKGFRTRMAQAVSQLDSLNSYKAIPPSGDSTDPTTYAEEHSSMNFITDGLSKTYKITNVCDFDNFTACDFPATIDDTVSRKTYIKDRRTMSERATSVFTKDNLGGIDTVGAAFRTRNGESVLLWYNPNCIPEQEVPEGGQKVWIREVCATFIVDLDGGKKGLNTMGKDIIYGAILYSDIPSLQIIIPQWSGSGHGTYKNLPGNSAASQCYYESYPYGSRYLPSKEEYVAMMANGVVGSSETYWTSSTDGADSDDYAWMMAGIYLKNAPRTTNATYRMCLIDPKF